MPADVAWWFVGLVDGEGCFYIAPTRCELIIKLRDDDWDVIEWLKGELGGLGRITHDKNREKAQVRWSADCRPEMRWLVEFFDLYPPRSKKARDYQVWREAVTYWLSGPRSRPDFSEFRQRISQVRKYHVRGAVA